MRKTARTALMAGLVLAVSACGNGVKPVPPEQVMPDLARYLVHETPDDGISQTEALTVTGIETRQGAPGEDGLVTVEALATVEDKSIYKGRFSMRYAEAEDGSFSLKKVDYVEPETWEVSAIGPLDEAFLKEAIAARKAIDYAGQKVPVSGGNVSVTGFEPISTMPDGKQQVQCSFDVSTEYVTYHTSAHLTVEHSINGYQVAASVIDGYEVELSDAYAFTLPDEELIRMLVDKGLLVGEQTVALSDVTEVLSRKESFDEKDLAMTVVAKVKIDKAAYTATADIYYTYKMNGKDKYWEMDSYHGTNFSVTEWKDIGGYYMGYVGGDAASLSVTPSGGNKLHAVLISSDGGKEREMEGEVDGKSLAVSFIDPETGNELLRGAYSADRDTFAGKYGKSSQWAFIPQAEYAGLSGEA